MLSDRPEDARDEGSRERLLQVPDAIVMDNGDRLTLAGIDIEAVAMYDLLPGEPFHAQGEGNGYILTLGDTRVYLSGVTECVPEDPGDRGTSTSPSCRSTSRTGGWSRSRRPSA